MDERKEAMTLIVHGCELARVLESNLPNLANQPNSLYSSCEKITGVFNGAIKLLNPPPPSSHTHMIFGGSSQSWPTPVSNDRDALQSRNTEAMDLLHAHALAGTNPFDVQVLLERKTSITERLELGLEIATDRKDLELNIQKDRNGAGDAEPSVHSRSTGELQGTDTSDSGRSSSMGAELMPRSRKRRERGSVYTQRVSAPRTGNLELPPDDGYTWRKYGQKEILNSRFPRSYYRCTHKNFYGCDAKKQVQRLDDDPFTFEVTYRGQHTCQTSATPLILGPPACHQEAQETTRVPSVSTSIQLASWLFSHVGSSQAQGGKEMESPVVDLADVMFNSGSSSNSVDAIFSSKQEN